MTRRQLAWQILLAARDFTVLAAFGFMVWFWSAIWAQDVMLKHLR